MAGMMELGAKEVEVIVTVFEQMGKISEPNDRETVLVKTAAFLSTENLNFGGISPIQMMRAGRSEKLLQCINDMIDGNIA